MARPKWNQYPIDDDIGYSGPLSYRHFKVIGWVLLILHMLVPMIKLGMSLDPFMARMLSVPASILELITPLSVFFLLIASMSQLITKGNYTKQMLTNGGATLGIILIFELIYHRYIVGTVDAFVGNRLATLSMINEIFSVVNPAGFMTFNVFLDLFLCTAVMFFLNYEPKKFFVGERLKWFRCLVILPIIYELVCLWLKLMANSGDFHMPLTLFPFLTAKPPMMFFVFCAMVIYQLTREGRFCSAGRTHEEYEAYLGTNRDTWQFARFAAIVCLIAGALDFIFVIVAIIGEVSTHIEALSAMSGDEVSLFGNQLIDKYANAGFGGSVDLLVFAPIMLLFNYRKEYENTTIELAIPLVSIVALLFIYLEAGLVAMGILAGIVKEEVLPQIAALISEFEQAAGEGTGEMGEDDLDALLEELLGGEVSDGDTSVPPASEVAPVTDAPPASEVAPVTDAPPASEAPPATEPSPAPTDTALASQQQPEPAYVPQQTQSYSQPTYAEPVYYEEPVYYTEPVYYEETVYYTEPQVTDAAGTPDAEQQTPEPAAPEQQAAEVGEPDASAPEQPAAGLASPVETEQQAGLAAPSETVQQDGQTSQPGYE